MELYLILLAAGDSRRFQGNKLLYPLAGKPMYRYVADEFEGLPGEVFSKKIVVTQYKEIGRDLKGMGYQVIENLHSEWGISYSIRLALESLAGTHGACCFAVCDQPHLKGRSVEELADRWRESGKGIGALCFRGEPGNPVIFSEKYREELLELAGDTGGKRVLKKHMDDVYLHEVESARQLQDIDERTQAITDG